MKSIFFSFLGSAVVVGLLYFCYWISSRHVSRKKAYAECWWLPGWNCFRFVIRNMRDKNNLTLIKYRSWLRSIKPSIPGCSTPTFVDTELTTGERILLPGAYEKDLPKKKIERVVILIKRRVMKWIKGEEIPLDGGQDLPVLCFRFEDNEGNLKFIHTDKLGTPINTYNISSETDSLKIEYYLKLQSWFLFKHEIVRTFEIPHYLPVDGKKVDVFRYLLKRIQTKGERSVRLVFLTAEDIRVAVAV